MDLLLWNLTVTVSLKHAGPLLFRSLILFDLQGYFKRDQDLQ